MCSFARVLGLNLLEVRFESVESVFPAPFLFRDPADEFVRRGDLQSTGPTLGVHPLANKPRSFEDPYVFGDRLQADRERLGQFFYRRVASGEASDDRRRVGSAKAEKAASSRSSVSVTSYEGRQGTE